MKDKDLLNLLTVMVGTSILIMGLVRSFYVDHIGVTLINISFILAIGLITASLFHISCELPSAVEEQWFQKTPESKGGIE
jgi:hypothetical protein